MPIKSLNHRLVKKNYCYSVKEISQLLNVHDHTVRNWIAEGLETIDSKRPKMIHGSSLKLFLEQRPGYKKVKCKDHELFCLKCREARAADKASSTIQHSQKGARYLLKAKCPVCGTQMAKKTNLKQFKNLVRKFNVSEHDPQIDSQLDLFG